MIASAVFGRRADFKETYLVADPMDHRSWNDYRNRVQRYRVLWAFFENSTYSSAHEWSAELRRAYGLYSWTRSVMSRANQVGEFHASHLMGGKLDLDAGDGNDIPSCLPIKTENNDIRAAIGSIWKWSNWQILKDVYCRTGAVKGDVAIKVVDDPDLGRVFLQVVQPETIKFVEKDRAGNVKGYVIEEFRPDPDWDYQLSHGSEPPYVTYTEICSRSYDPATGEYSLMYQTFRSGEPYDWHVYEQGEAQIGSTWKVDYGFVPLFMVQHINIGMDWGWSEVHSALPRCRELDDLASCMTDQARKQLNGPWAINSRRPSDATDNKARPTADEVSNSPSLQPGRDSMQIKWIDNPDLKVVHMVGDMKIDDICKYVDQVNAVLESDLPELASDGGSLSSGSSGRSQKIQRQKAEAKVHQRRASYDDALVRAHKAAISIAAIGGYEGFEAFTEESYELGKLDHSIDKRPVFAVDPMDDLEEEAAFWNGAVAATNSGLPLEVYLSRNGWSEEKVKEVTSLLEKAQEKAFAQSKLLAAQQSKASLIAKGGNPAKPKESPKAPPTAPDPEKPNT
jgi:hypothetical protein